MAENVFGTAAILAGGRSVRMGFDKQLLTINERRLFDIIYNTLTLKFKDIIVCTYRPNLYNGYSIRTIRDQYRNSGPLSGIHSALKASKSHYVYIIACDMPNINMPYIDYMEQLIKGNDCPDACITQKYNWIEPFNAYYSKSCLPVIEDDLLNGKTSIRYFLQKVRTLEIKEEKAREFSENWSMFLNLNTRENYEEYARSACFSFK